MSEAVSAHAISLYLRNRPGVMNRVGLVFSRRGWNVDSISVSPAEDGRFARCTIVAVGPDSGVQRIIAQLTKLVEVVACRLECADESVVTRELALIKVRCAAGAMNRLRAVAASIGCVPVDWGSDTVMFQIVGEHTDIDHAREVLAGVSEVFDILRTGSIIMHRGDGQDSMENVRAAAPHFTTSEAEPADEQV